MSGDNSMGGVIISPNMKRTKEMIDTAGNVIDPETKTVLELNTPPYVPTKEEIEAGINAPKDLEVQTGPITEARFNPENGLPIQQQIEEAEAHLADLKEKKKEEIARRKAELAALEAE